MSKMFRISEHSAKKLEDLSKLIKKTKQKILDQALDRYMREILLKKANEQYAILKKDKKFIKEEKEELELWNSTLQDGFDD